MRNVINREIQKAIRGRAWQRDDIRKRGLATRPIQVQVPPDLEDKLKHLKLKIGADAVGDILLEAMYRLLPELEAELEAAEEDTEATRYARLSSS